MFVGMRELRRAPGRIGPITAVVGLITMLLVLLTGLTAGLGKQNTSALEALNPAGVIFEDPEDPSFTTSRIDDAPAGTTPLGTAQTLLQDAQGNEQSVAVLGLPEGTQLPGGEQVGDGAVASSSLGLALDDEVTLGAATTSVDAVVEDTHYSHTPVIWVPTQVWQQVAHTDAVGTVALTDDADAPGAVTLKESFQGLSAYQSEQGSLLTMQGFLYAISALVTVAFLSVWTIQRTRDLSILKAIGATNGYLLRDALGQAAVILAIGVVAGTLLAAAIGLAAATVVPFSLGWLSILGPAAGIWVLGMIGAALTTRTITRINPNDALAGATA